MIPRHLQSKIDEDKAKEYESIVESFNWSKKIFKKVVDATLFKYPDWASETHIGIWVRCFNVKIFTHGEIEELRKDMGNEVPLNNLYDIVWENE